MRAAIWLAVALLAGCASTDAASRWVDHTLYGTAQGPPQAAYAGADHVEVYREPDVSAPVQGVLDAPRESHPLSEREGLRLRRGRGQARGLGARAAARRVSRPRAEARGRAGSRDGAGARARREASGARAFGLRPLLTWRKADRARRGSSPGSRPWCSSPAQRPRAAPRCSPSIQEGSRPTAVYYVLLGISALIAGFALIIDSDATLIGANVVAPLMMPIFGIALGLARGDLKLLRIALLAEFGGAAIGVALCFLLGLLPFAVEPTPSLLAQTRPTLIDLMVATLAGLAGALAMIDERVSPVLPGVAIATALNPPVAAIGLCLALGAYEGAWGAFLLFFANVLAILAVAGAMFVIAGFVTRAEIGSFGGLVRRFSGAALGLLARRGAAHAAISSTMVDDLRTERAIRETLDLELAQEPSTALEKIEFDRRRDAVEVLSTVMTPRVIAPGARRADPDCAEPAARESPCGCSSAAA